MTAIVNYLTTNLPYADENEKEFLQTTIDELNAELNRNAEKAAANRELYDSAKNIIFDGFTRVDKPITIAELYEEIKNELPQGFSKSKVQYAVTRLWADEIVKIEGKTNTYTVKAE